MPVRGKLSATPLWDFSIGFGLPEIRSGWRSDRLTFDAANSAITSGYVAGGECAQRRQRAGRARLPALRSDLLQGHQHLSAALPVLERALPTILVGATAVRRGLSQRDPLPVPGPPQGRRCARHGAHRQPDHRVENPAERRGLHAAHREESVAAGLHVPLEPLPHGSADRARPQRHAAGLLRQGDEVVPRLDGGTAHLAGRQPPGRVRCRERGPRGCGRSTRPRPSGQRAGAAGPGAGRILEARRGNRHRGQGFVTADEQRDVDGLPADRRRPGRDG